MIIYADNTKVYLRKAIPVDEESLAIDPSSELARTVQQKKDYLVTFNDSEIKLMTFDNH